ncbi:hypothetical protein [Metabacillus litoralis]|uniref:hypothetical protein n=1 Tax=Metabacillus litoralis TaxID=152268 RepID=UPI001CFD9F9A|nr:hypothetical protein [Metabacillus litoralis]
MKFHRNPQLTIGQPWTGKHVILIQCDGNTFKQLYKSYHAPVERPRYHCAETLSQLLSIGYKVYKITPLHKNQIQYFLILE